MDTYRDLITAWGGPTPFARDIGISADAARQMSSRNKIDPSYFPVVVARAPLAGLRGVTLDFLFSLKSGREVIRSRGRFPAESRVN